MSSSATGSTLCGRLQDALFMYPEEIIIGKSFFTKKKVYSIQISWKVKQCVTSVRHELIDTFARMKEIIPCHSFWTLEVLWEGAKGEYMGHFPYGVLGIYVGKNLLWFFK